MPVAAEKGVKVVRRVPGEVGAWIFILGDMTVFALLFGVFLDARSTDPALFDSQQELLNRNFGAINTLLLLTSSLLVVTGIKAIRASDTRWAPRLVFAALVVGGGGFTLMKYVEWSDKIAHGITPATNDFWMYYFVLTGLHFFHLLIGCVVLAFLGVQARKTQIDASRMGLIEGGACFWHMVDLLWIVLFPLLYLVH